MTAEKKPLGNVVAGDRGGSGHCLTWPLPEGGGVCLGFTPASASALPPEAEAPPFKGFSPAW